MVSVTGSIPSILTPAQKSQLTSIKSTARLVDDVQLRLASGKAVNNALDNPQNFFTGEALEFRANDLARRLDGIGQSIRTLQETDHGIEAALKVLDLADAYLRDVEKRYLSGDIVLEDTGPPTNVTQIEPTVADIVSYAGSQDSGGPATVLNGGEDIILDANQWKRILINYNITADTVLEFEYASNLQPEIAAIGFDNDNAFNNDNDRFYLYGTQSSGITYSTPIGTHQYLGPLGTYQSYEIPIGQYFTGTYSHITFINDDDAGPSGDSLYRNVFLREGPINTTPQAPPELQEEYESILDQLDRVAVDASYRGINLLENETLETIFNEDASSRLVSQGIDATSNGLGLLRADFNSVEAVQDKILQISKAREVLRSYGGTVANDLNIIRARETFTRDIINDLLGGRDDLVLDDQNKAGAEFLALQVRQQIQFSTLATPQASITDFI